MEVSSDKQSWTEVASDTLPHPNTYPDCGTPLHEYDVAPAVAGRFVKFNVKTFHGNGGGLKYFNVVRSGTRGALDWENVQDASTNA